MKYKCLIVDDEKLARSIIVQYVNKVDFLHLSGECASAIEALNFLQAQQIDILFIDVKMPELSGVDLVKSLCRLPSVVFTTAYSQYAIDAFDVEAVDYLRKPISFERFLKAVNRCVARSGAVPVLTPKPIKSDAIQEKILLNTDKGNKEICLTEIDYIKAHGNYTKVYLGDRYILCRDNLLSMESRLPLDVFVRIHKSYIISLPKVSVLDGDFIYTAKQKLPVGRTYKNAIKRLNLNA